MLLEEIWHVGMWDLNSFIEKSGYCHIVTKVLKVRNCHSLCSSCIAVMKVG